MRLTIVNLGDTHDGSLEGGQIAGDAISCAEGVVDWIGSSGEVDLSEHHVVIDAAGTTLVPGFIDSHVHTTFGDYTPRQQTLGFLDSYLHGGTTRTISASEVHVPGRPHDVVGVKALAIAAQRCFADYRPAGVTVHAGSVILEPGLAACDFEELRSAGVWLAKAGFGAFASARDYVPVVQAAKAAGLVVMCHTGGGSIGGSLAKIGVDDLIAMQPNVAGHVNGGPTALTASENARIVEEGMQIALQVVHAGNLRSAIDITERALERGHLGRLLIATDTPTGSGVIPLGMLRTMAELSSLGPLSGRQAVTAATGNVAEVYGLTAGRLEVGRPADFVLLDAPQGSAANSAMEALEIGDVPSVAMVATAGTLRLAVSRNSPPPKRPVSVSGEAAP
jgi:enamidase